MFSLNHWQRLLLLLVVGSPTVLVFPAVGVAKSEIRTDGTIAIGNSTRIILNESGVINITRDNGDKYEAFIPLTRVADGKWFSTMHLDSRKVSVDSVNKVTTFRGTFTAPNQPKPIPVEISVAALEGSKVRIELRYATDVPINSVLSSYYMQFQSQRSQHVGQKVTVGDKTTVLPTDKSSETGSKPIYADMELPSVTYFPDDIERKLVITPVQAASIGVQDSNRPPQPTVGTRFFPKDNVLIYELGFSGGDKAASPETYFGVDYMAANRFRLPRYGVSRNLVQNSGFEAGFQSWRFGRLGRLTESRLGDYYQIEEKAKQNGAVFAGKRSLKIRGEKGQSPAHLNSFAIPVESGAQYTLSFYARADRPNLALNLYSVTAVWGTFIPQRFVLTQEWKRYSFSFNAPNEMLNVDFGLDNPAEDCAAWIDNVQLEKGPLTDYAAKPVSASIITNRRGNWLQPGEKIDARLVISGKPQTRGNAAIKVTDLYGRVIREESKPFTLGADGSAQIALGWAQNLGRGLFLIETNLKASDFTDRDFSRITIAPYADNTASHKNLFAYGGEDQRVGSWARRLEFFKRAGIGSAFLHIPPPHQFPKLMEDNRILDASSIFDNSDSSGKWFLKENYHLTEDELKIVEENAYRKAKEFPEIRYWRLVNEPGSKMSSSLAEMREFVKPMLAARRGIRRAAPNARVLSPDPSNLAPQNGINWMDMFLEAGGKEACDIIAIHPYRPRPEEPDLDSDIATFIKVLDKHKYQGEIWFTEGMSNFGMNLPAWGVDTHRALSQEGASGGWRVGALTYDIGLGERVAAAYSMRYWLVGLKYGDRVKQYVSWYFPMNSTLDYDQTPTAEIFATNTLTELLGDSSFKQDIELGEGVRGYLFEDGKKRPVAALWSYDLRVDKGDIEGPLVDISTLPAGCEVIDFTGKSLPRTKEIRLSSLPLFIRGRAGSGSALAQTLAALPLTSPTSRQLMPFIKMTGAGSAEIRLQNLLARPVGGRLQVTQAGKTLYDEAITVNGKTIRAKPLPVVSQTGRLTEQRVQINFKPAAGAQPQVSELSLETLTIARVEKPLTIDGDLADWPTESALPLQPRIITFGQNAPAHGGPTDLSGTFYSAWDADNLYLAFQIRDDNFMPGPRSNLAWRGDGVQIYFDSFQNAGAATKPSFDSDDQNFDLWPGPDGLEVRRVITPDVQLAFLKPGAVDTAKRSFKRMPDGYVLELAIPIRELAPISFKAGESFGFSFIINDKDDEANGRKRGLTLTPAGTEPFNHPELFTVVTLQP